MTFRPNNIEFTLIRKVTAGAFLLVFQILVISDICAQNISAPEDSIKTSLFHAIYELAEPPTIQIQTDVDQLLEYSENEVYQEAFTTILDQGNEMVSLPSKVRTRTYLRKKICAIPPIRVNFPKGLLRSLGYSESDKLKLLNPCLDEAQHQERLYREHFLYDLYNLIDTNGLRSTIVHIQINSNQEERYNFKAVLLEDEDAYIERKNASIVTQNNLNQRSMDRLSFLKMMFFQYMIGNTDWAIPFKHNLEMVRLPGIEKIVALPYDFDFSGFVGQSYAEPKEDLPIKSVKERYFFPFKISDAEYDYMIAYYQSLEKPVMDLLDKATYMAEETRQDCSAYLAEFFEAIKDPKALKPYIKRR
ncbi:MAG: hypothetical protein KJP00_16890 [Bacteroidia bacterium]|nr:hypothetical protein [Bacteroidia bacterium]